ncbi:MAG: hypothetical protein ACKVP0_03810 [Pirellulaceae bacterium]
MSSDVTEAEWLSTDDSEKLAFFIHYRYRDQPVWRKQGLLACACIRRIWPLLTDEGGRRAIAIKERSSDEPVSEDELREAHSLALNAWKVMADEADDGKYATPLLRAIPDAGLAAYHVLDGDLQSVGNCSDAAACFAAPPDTPEWKRAKLAESKMQVQVMHCIFGNPFRPVRFELAWATPHVQRIAQRIYANAAHDEYPSLADSLEAAGCNSQEVLNHCRSAGLHVKGCWVVDAILEKG